ncbi:hypothetical protein QUA41_31030, partial [Microcoleus sp. Pol11C1]|uniref:hypothetical protein n=1 Tax=unclassified Microcoleus TaxID=2642155 RepID=UPI002FCF58BB
EMRSRFEHELKDLGGSQMSVSLLTGSEVIESYRVNDFEFMQVQDFDSDNPEFEVAHLPTQKTFTVYHKGVVETGRESVNLGWRNSVYPWANAFPTREGAAADAVRRLLKAQSAE